MPPNAGVRGQSKLKDVCLVPGRARPGAVDQQLLQLTEEARLLSNTIATALQKTTNSGSDHRAFRSVQQAFRALWTRKELSELEAKLDNLRRRVDTALLMSLREDHLYWIAEWAAEKPIHLVQLNLNPRIVSKLFPDRWEQFESFGGGRELFGRKELQRAFDLMLSYHQVSFFAIDSLDELDGDPKDLVTFALTATKRRNVKLKRREPQHAQKVKDEAVGKAAGVFLWVYLVVESIAQRISNADRISDLQARLDAMPGDLEALFDKLFNRLDPIYFQHTCQLFCLQRTHMETAPSSPDVLQLFYADDEDIESGMREREALTPSELVRMCEEQAGRSEEMVRRLQSRCKGFLEMYEEGNRPPKIRYLHRTARGYLHSDKVWAIIREATDDPSFILEERWANAFIRFPKIYEPCVNYLSPFT
ncbi:hypothetical protein K458DRAFT_407282 [Lentithecium fluviatile CBS 122367]|uniref:DUF7791 domain-containing protein n=1 Tax=Lentithecium fluviatile CBS 122367 TaxID=1168545 RepID=A0A6G1IRD8_9PLEO|nr:hypothetical protein K458DRAFT_407282 [Lentithecium fluviatile CBS 122367]